MKLKIAHCADLHLNKGKKENTFNGISTPFFNEADKKEPEQELDG